MERTGTYIEAAGLRLHYHEAGSGPALVMLHGGIKIESSLGRHTNDRMVSFYADTPSGFQVEYGCDAIVVDDDVWTTAKEINADAFWGHRWSS